MLLGKKRRLGIPAQHQTDFHTVILKRDFEVNALIRCVRIFEFWGNTIIFCFYFPPILYIKNGWSPRNPDLMLRSYRK